MNNSGLFLAGLGVTILLCLIEGLALLLAGTSTPSFMDIDSDKGETGGGILGYLNAGHLPLTLFIASFAAVFGITGLAIQQGSVSAFGAPLAIFWAAPLSVLAAVPGTHFVTKALGALLPKTETTAISVQDLIGREGLVMAGTGQRGSPVQVKLRDQFGQSHYVMVEPMRDDDVLRSGQAILITARVGSIYHATKTVAEIVKESTENGQ